MVAHRWSKILISIDVRTNVLTLTKMLSLNLQLGFTKCIVEDDWDVFRDRDNGPKTVSLASCFETRPIRNLLMSRDWECIPDQHESYDIPHEHSKTTPDPLTTRDYSTPNEVLGLVCSHGFALGLVYWFGEGKVPCFNTLREDLSTVA